MQRVETCVGLDSVVSSMLFNQVFYDVQVAIEGGVKQRGVTFIIAVVDPQLKRTTLAIYTAAGALSPLAPEFGLSDIDLDEFDMTLEGQLMQHGISLGVLQLDNIDVVVILEILLKLLDIAVGEQFIDDFAALAVDLHRN